MPHYPPRPPPGMRRMIWNQRIWLESTFATSMMQPWEKALIVTVLTFVTLLIWFSIYTYLPSHIEYLAKRWSYYVYGDETVEVSAPIKAWIRVQVGRLVGGIKDNVVGKTKLEL
ncbi:uncharacterized protein I303_104596 [Kwoniella dejecticola CBS 10117]|uniref:Uncharacterized protein n=1 Tax=Kwoniella dejecticola CBS 10117 TaxID=1296121 RepID=A0A1A6A4V6_9TREE|nr:uncharacterized protein I303_04426 [Kwoniella dejecticola CBS 10117]OBR85095.1 hypothetical protein I303_04426 [Kwoniella dejecticola CBS 10117]